MSQKLGVDSTVFAVILLAVAYATGLILSMWGLDGAKEATKKPFLNGGTLLRYLRFTLRWLRWKWLQWTAGLPPLPDASVDAFGDMGEIMEGICGLSYMPFLLEPTSQFPLFRAVVMDRLKDKAVNLFQEADVQRRKFLFSLGVSQALNVLALSVALRYGLAKGAEATSKGLPAWLPLNDVYSILFALLAIVAIATTFRINDDSPIIAAVNPIFHTDVPTDGYAGNQPSWPILCLPHYLQLFGKDHAGFYFDPASIFCFPTLHSSCASLTRPLELHSSRFPSQEQAK